MHVKFILINEMSALIEVQQVNFEAGCDA